MSILKRMKKKGKESAIVKIKFPSDKPELELHFERIAHGEMRFIHERALQKALATGGLTDAVLGVAVSTEVAAKLEHKLKTWVCLGDIELEPTSKNREKFFNTLELGELLDMSRLYLAASAEEAEQAEGNGDTLEEDS